MSNEKLIISSKKYRGDSTVISIRLPDELVKELDKIVECTPKIEQCVSLMNITYAVTAGNSKENLLFFCFANNETKLTKRINFRVNFD